MWLSERHGISLRRIRRNRRRRTLLLKMATISDWGKELYVRLRPREKKHPMPHFHMYKRGEIDASVQISPFEILEGEDDIKSVSKLQGRLTRWVNEHEDELLDAWQSFVIEGKPYGRKIAPPSKW